MADHFNTCDTTDADTVLPTDHDLVGWVFPPEQVQGGTIVPTAGLLQVVRVRAMSTLATNLLMYVTTAGATLTANRCLAALFTDAGALLAATGNQATAWESTGLKTMALTAAQAVTPGAWYRIGFYSNGTTQPTFARGAAVAAGTALNAGLSTPRWSTADAGLTTAMPSTLGAQTAIGTAWWAAIS